jgi:hypothetical protein
MALGERHSLADEVWLVPRRFSPFNNVYRIQTKHKDTQKLEDSGYWIKTEYHWWERLLTTYPYPHPFARLPTAVAWQVYDYSRPSYTMYYKSNIVAYAKTGATASKQLKMEFRFENEPSPSIRATRKPNEIQIHAYDPEIRCYLVSQSPTSKAIETQVCGYELTADKARFQRVTIQGTKLKLLDVYHSRIFHIKRINGILPMAFMCMLVYFWERNQSISLASLASASLTDASTIRRFWQMWKASRQ